MSLERANRDGLVLYGCGKMGAALLQGWLARGLNPRAVTVIEPAPSDWVRTASADAGVALNAPLPRSPAVCVVAVKPQVMTKVLGELRCYGNGATLVVSIAAGVTLRRFEESLGTRTPLVRTVPNTPAAIGKGITALVGNTAASEADMALAEALLGAVGKTETLDSEDAMDAVTAVSGSGPAYVFLLIETLAAAGVACGLRSDLAMRLAKSTVAGAGSLAETASEEPSELRRNVTSPGGTTEAALEVLMDRSDGLGEMLVRAVRAAERRGRELGK